MIIKNFSDYKLYESPDTVYYKADDEIRSATYNDATVGAKPFAWIPDLDDNKKKKLDENGMPIRLEFWIGDLTQGHSDDCPFLVNNGGDYFYDWLLYKGRLWFNSETTTEVWDDEEGCITKDVKPTELKIISFWDIQDISDQEMKLLIEDLQKETGLDLSDWSVDVGGGFGVATELVPVTDYVGVKLSETEKKIQELRLRLHTASPSEKQNIIDEIEKLSGEKIKKPEGFGSEYYKGKLPKGMSQAEYKNKKTKYKFTESVKSFEDYIKINENR